VFFSLGPEPDTRLPCHDRVFDQWFSHDVGWHLRDKVFYKGYDHPNLDHGNSITIRFDSEQIIIDHDGLRSCPLWLDRSQGRISNLLGTGQRIWADGEISWYNNEIIFQNRDVIGHVSDQTQPLHTVVDKIRCNLQAKFDALENELKIMPQRLFVTGGLDTLTLWCFASSYKAIECLDHEHFEYDEFTNNCYYALSQQHWAYRQIHHWKQPNILISGACGDEFFMRGPSAVAMWCAWHDIDLMAYIEGRQGYQVAYYLKPENRAIFLDAWQKRYAIRERYHDELSLKHALLDMIANDHQHWHLGNTLTWTPFKDIELAKLMLSLAPNELLAQILDGVVNRAIMQEVNPQALDWLSKHKNKANRANLPTRF